MSSTFRFLQEPVLSVRKHKLLLQPIEPLKLARPPTYFYRICPDGFPWSFPSMPSPELARSITGSTPIVLVFSRHPYLHSNTSPHLCQDPLYLLPENRRHSLPWRKKTPTDYPTPNSHPWKYTYKWYYTDWGSYIYKNHDRSQCRVLISIPMYISTKHSWI